MSATVKEEAIDIDDEVDPVSCCLLQNLDRKYRKCWRILVQNLMIQKLVHKTNLGWSQLIDHIPCFIYIAGDLVNRA